MNVMMGGGTGMGMGMGMNPMGTGGGGGMMMGANMSGLGGIGTVGMMGGMTGMTGMGGMSGMGGMGAMGGNLSSIIGGISVGGGGSGIVGSTITPPPPTTTQQTSTSSTSSSSSPPSSSPPTVSTSPTNVGVIGGTTASAAAATVGGGVSSGAPSRVNSKYGLMGLLPLIHLQDPEMTILQLGPDLTTLGLNLNTREYLYLGFSSPWSEQRSFIQPEYSVPMCYKTHGQMEVKEDHLSHFKDDTLFYMFYAMPRDAMQMIAARELQKRGWTWIREQQLWVKESTGEFFDVNSWKKNTVPTVLLSTVLQQQQQQLMMMNSSAVSNGQQESSDFVDGLNISTESLHQYVNQIAREDNERSHTGSHQNGGVQTKGSSDIAKQQE